MGILTMLSTALLPLLGLAALGAGLAAAVITLVRRRWPVRPAGPAWAFGPPAVAMAAAAAAAPPAIALGDATGLAALAGSWFFAAGAAVGAGTAFAFVAGVGAAWLPAWRRDATWLRAAGSAAMAMSLGVAIAAPILAIGPGRIAAAYQIGRQVQAAQQAAGPTGGFPPTLAPRTFTAEQAAATGHVDVRLGDHTIRMPIRPGWEYKSGALRGTQMVIVRSTTPGERAQFSLTAWTPNATAAMLSPGCEADAGTDATMPGNTPLGRAPITFTTRPSTAIAYERGGERRRLARTCQGEVTMDLLLICDPALYAREAPAFEAFAAGIRID